MAAKQCATHLRHMHTASSATARIPLAYEVHGPKTRQPAGHQSPIIFLHGFLGSKRENTRVSKLLSQDLSRQVYTLDLRNHGDSGHHRKHDYMEMALDVELFIKKHGFGSATIIGHSMGAKTALTLALYAPDIISDVVAVDNCPISLPIPDGFQRYMEGLAEVEQARVQTHVEGEQILANFEESPIVRLFLVSNFVKDRRHHYLRSRLPLNTLKAALGSLGDFPYDAGRTSFPRPTLFLRSRNSHYIPDSAFPQISSLFPCSKIVDMNCGHWIVQENPEKFRQIVCDFLKSH